MDRETKRNLGLAIEAAKLKASEKTDFSTLSDKSVNAVVAKVVEDNPELWVKLREEFAFRTLTSLVVRALRRGTDKNQGTLPGFEGLPRVVLIGKARLPIGDVTLAQIQGFVKGYKSNLEVRSEREGSTLKELRRLARIVKAYSKGDDSITVAAALQLRDKHLAKREVTKKRVRS